MSSRAGRFTIQLKSFQTNSIREEEPGRFTADIQCDASDRRTIRIPTTGTEVQTTCYLAGEFNVLCVGLHPFVGSWEFAFRLNSTLPRSTRRTKLTKHLTDAELGQLLKTLVSFEWPMREGGPWTRDLFGLLRGAPDLGEVIEASKHRRVVRLPGSKRRATVEDE